MKMLGIWVLSFPVWFVVAFFISLRLQQYGETMLYAGRHARAIGWLLWAIEGFILLGIWLIMNGGAP